MKNDIKINFDIKSIFKVISRYGLTLFIIVVVGALSAAVLILTKTIDTTSSTNSMAPTDNINSFDQSTIDRVNQLKTGDNNASNYSPPSGRINPFGE